MKKVFSKFAVLFMAIVMVCAFAACDDDKPSTPSGAMVQVNSAGEALSGAAAAMLKQNGITVTLNGSVSALGEIAIDSDTSIPLDYIGIKGTAKLSRSASDMDFDTEATVTMGTGQNAMPIKVQTIKKGNKMYTSLMGMWSEETTESIAIPAMPEEVLEELKSFDMGSFVKNSDNYTLTLSLDVKDKLNALKSFLSVNGNKTVNELLFPGNTDEQNQALAAKLEELFDETLTVDEFVEKINEIINMNNEEGAPEKSLKSITDALTAQAGITAADVKQALEQVMGVALPDAQENQTVYDYVLGMIPQGTTVGELAEMLESIFGAIGGGSVEGAPYAADEGDTVEEVNVLDMIIAVLTQKEDMPTIADIYDKIVGLIDIRLNLDSFLKYVGDASVVQKLGAIGDRFNAANIADMTFGDNKVELKVVLNGNLTVRSISIVLKSDVKYNNEQLINYNVNIDLSFGYGAVVITAPQMQAAA